MRSLTAKTADLLIALSLITLLASAKAIAGKFPGQISQVKGIVEVQKGVSGKWYKAAEGLPLQLKDRIRTDKASSCDLELDDGSLIYVDENTEASVEFIELTKEKHTSTIGLWLGKLLSNVKKTPSTKMKIKCPTAVISVRGTEFAVEADTASANVGVFEGMVSVSSDTEKTGEELDAQASTAAPQGAALNEVSVKPGEETTVDKGAAPKPPTRLSLLMQKNRERMNELRGRVEQLREKLKREKPEYLDKVRQSTLDRFIKAREQRNGLREKLKNEREQIK